MLLGDAMQGDMVVEPQAPKVYLQNRLTKCRTKLEELRPVITSKRGHPRFLSHLGRRNRRLTRLAGKEMESFARMMANNVGPDKAANREEATDVSSSHAVYPSTEGTHRRQ